MFKADTKLHRTDGSNDFDFRYLADFVIEYFDVSKKLTETAFCVTKNRFFLIRFLICVYRTTVRGCCLADREKLFDFSTLPIGLSSIFEHFFRFFWKTFLFSFNRYFSNSPLLETTHALYHKLFSLVNCFQGIFSSFFRFFSKPCRTCFDCPVRFGQLVYPITNGFICQLFFGTFFRFFPIFFQTGFSSSQGPSLRQLAYIITLYRPCQLFLCLFCHYF